MWKEGIVGTETVSLSPVIVCVGYSKYSIY